MLTVDEAVERDRQQIIEHIRRKLQSGEHLTQDQIYWLNGYTMTLEELLQAQAEQIRQMANCTTCANMNYLDDGDTVCSKGFDKCQNFNLWKWQGER